jgi:hypothetical protein
MTKSSELEELGGIVALGCVAGGNVVSKMGWRNEHKTYGSSSSLITLCRTSELEGFGKGPRMRGGVS